MLLRKILLSTVACDLMEIASIIDGTDVLHTHDAIFWPNSKISSRPCVCCEGRVPRRAIHSRVLTFKECGKPPEGICNATLTPGPMECLREGQSPIAIIHFAAILGEEVGKQLGNEASFGVVGPGIAAMLGGMDIGYIDAE